MNPEGLDDHIPGGPLSCPVLGCVQTAAHARDLRQHLLLRHNKNEIFQAHAFGFLADRGIYMCTYCNDSSPTLYLQEHRYDQHVLSKHTRPRLDSNSSICRSLFHTGDSFQEEWDACLAYFADLSLTPSNLGPSEHCKKLPHGIKSSLLQLNQHLWRALLRAEKPCPSQSSISQGSSIPLWKMFFLFEPCLLAPKLPSEEADPELRYLHRIRLFNHGRMHEIHQEVAAQVGRVPADQVLPPDLDSRNRRVIAAVNANQLSRAMTALRPSQVAVNSDHNISLIRKEHIFPPCSHARDHHLPKVNPPLNDEQPEVMAMVNPVDIIESLKQMPTQSSQDVHGSSVDFLRATALHYDGAGNRPGADLLSQIYSLLYHGRFPTSIDRWYSSNRFAAFHKDFQTDPDKLRPIDCGSALRRAACSHANRQNTAKFAATLAPSQFAIGVPGGMDIVIHTAMLSVDSFVSRTRADFRRRHLPTRVQVLMDLEKMFTRVSRKRIRELLAEKFPHLLNLFDLNSGHVTRSYYRTPDGLWHYLEQEEGLAQGCPLSPPFSSLVLAEILSVIHAELDVRAAARKAKGDLGDDGHGSRTSCLSYMDDTSGGIPYVDLSFLFHRLVLLGRPVGIVLSRSKNIFITSTNGESPLGLLPRDLKNEVRSVIAEFGGDKGEVLDGAKLLGSPVGNIAYSRSFLADRLKRKCIEPVEAIITTVSDHHASLILLRFCVQAMTNHLHFVDVLTGLNASSTPTVSYESEFSSAVRDQHIRLLSHIAGRDITPLAWLIATSYVGDGGLGLRDVVANNLQGFIFPLARSLQYATNGISPIKRTCTEHADIVEPFHLAPAVRDLFLNWERSQTPMFVKFRLFAPPLLEYDPDLALIEDPLARLQHLVRHCPLKAVRRRINRARQRELFRQGMTHQPLADQAILTSLMNEYTSLPASSMTRAERAFRWNPRLFQTFMQRKLRLPLFNDPCPKCSCGAVVDAMGDHIWSCPAYSFPRDGVHDAFRNASWAVFSNLGPLAGFVSSSHEVMHEPQNLISECPRLRPGDTALAHETVGNALFTYTLIDYSTSVKLTDLPLPSEPVSASLPTTEQVTLRHETGENGKLRGPQRDSRRYPIAGRELIRKLTQQNMLLRPFTVDSFGLIGPLASITFTGKSLPHLDRHAKGERCSAGLGHPEARHMLDLNYSSAAPAGLFPKADRQWRQDLEELGRHPSTHWFSGSYHARLPSQWAKQVLGFNITRALMQYYSNAALKLRRQEVVKTSGVAPVGVPGISRSSVLAPRPSINMSHGADPRASSNL